MNTNTLLSSRRDFFFNMIWNINIGIKFLQQFNLPTGRKGNPRRCIDNDIFSLISHFWLPQLFRLNSSEMEKLCTFPFLTKMPPCLPQLFLQPCQKIFCQAHKVLMPEDTLPPPQTPLCFL